MRQTKTGFSSLKRSIQPGQRDEKMSRPTGQRSEVLADSQLMVYSQHAIFYMFNLPKVTSKRTYTTSHLLYFKFFFFLLSQVPSEGCQIKREVNLIRCNEVLQVRTQNEIQTFTPYSFPSSISFKISANFCVGGVRESKKNVLQQVLAH